MARALDDDKQPTRRLLTRLAPVGGEGRQLDRLRRSDNKLRSKYDGTGLL